MNQDWDVLDTIAAVNWGTSGTPKMPSQALVPINVAAIYPIFYIETGSRKACQSTESPFKVNESW